MKLPKKKEIISAYNKADEKGKELLQSLYPDMEFEQKPIIERIKTLEDACAILGEDHLYVQMFRDIYNKSETAGANVNKDIVAYLKLRIIIAALNEGWDVKKPQDGFYWRVIFRGGSYAFAFSSLVCTSANIDALYALSNVCSRLVFKSEELADYCAKQFADLWRDYFVG